MGYICVILVFMHQKDGKCDFWTVIGDKKVRSIESREIRTHAVLEIVNYV